MTIAVSHCCQVVVKRQTGGVFGYQGDGHPLEAIYVACSGRESGPGHFILHYMGAFAKYPGPEAPSCFLSKANQKRRFL